MGLRVGLHVVQFQFNSWFNLSRCSQLLASLNHEYTGLNQPKILRIYFHGKEWGWWSGCAEMENYFVIMMIVYFSTVCGLCHKVTLHLYLIQNEYHTVLICAHGRTVHTVATYYTSSANLCHLQKMNEAMSVNLVIPHPEPWQHTATIVIAIT